MKISKTRLKDIIKEELTKFNIRRMSEDANDDTFEMLDALTGAMGETAVLENIVQAMDRQTAHDILGGIAQDYGIPMGGGEEY